jgi:hypothetical protein
LLLILFTQAFLRTTNREFRLSLRKFLSLVLRLFDHQITRSPDHPILMSINLRSSRGICGEVCGSAALCLRASVVDLLFDLPLIF